MVEPSDVQRSDLLIGVAVTAAVFLSSVLALAHSRLAHRADLPTIDPGTAIPIAVRPVADLPAGSGVGAGAAPTTREGGRPSARPLEATPVVPEAWRKPQAPRPRKRAHHPVTSDASTPSTDEPSLDEPSPSEATAEPPFESATDAEGEPGAEPGGEAQDGPAGEGEGPGEASGEAGGGGGEGGGGEGGGEAGVDPLLERAIAFYRARLVAWFSARFRVSGSGLSSADLAKHRVRVKIEVGEDLSIVDYRILSSDHPAFEKAARDTLDGLRGQTLPPPPENYPGAVQRQLTVTFTCAEDTCD